MEAYVAVQCEQSNRGLGVGILAIDDCILVSDDSMYLWRSCQRNAHVYRVSDDCRRLHLEIANEESELSDSLIAPDVIPVSPEMSEMLKRVIHGEGVSSADNFPD